MFLQKEGIHLSVFANATFCFLDLSKEYNCSSILVFGNVRYKMVVKINHDNVASRGAVGRTHSIVRFQTGNRRKDPWNGEFRGFPICVG